MKVAVIVPVLNEEVTVGPLLESLRAQTQPPDEIVIGDGGSTDATLKILARLAADEPRLRVVKGAGGSSENRNAAIRATRSEIVACTDAGCIPEPEWLQRLTEPFSAGADWVAGFYRPLGATAASTAAGAVMMTTEAEVDLDHFLPGGSSQAFRRSVWERAGGFPEGHGVGEDTLFGERLRSLGYKPVFVPDAVVTWQPPPDLRAMARKARSWGRADGTNQVRTGAYAKVLLAYWFFPALVVVAAVLSPLLGLAGLVVYVALVAYRIRHKLSAVAGWSRFLWVPLAHIRQQMEASAGWISGYGWQRLFRKVLLRLGARPKMLEREAPVRHNVDVLVRTEREVDHWLSLLPTSYRVGTGPPDPEVALVTATMTPASGEPIIEPVTVEYGPEGGASLDDPVARYEHLRQTGQRYQLTPSPGGAAHRADLIEAPIAVVVLAAVPLHDVGGGSRGAQLALEMAQRGIHVTYVHRFDAAETVDLGLRFIHPLLEERRFDAFNVGAYLDRLRSPNRFAMVEFPEGAHAGCAEMLKGRGRFEIAYDLIDDWSDEALGGWGYQRAIEDTIIANASVLLASAPALQASLEARSGRPVTLVPNAVNTNVFDPTRSYPRPVDLPTGQIFEYHGSLYGDWFSWEAVRAVANDYPGATVVLIGDPPAARPTLPANVHLLGLKPQQELPGYLAHSSVALIPFVVSATTHAVSPLKVYEYLAMAVPVAAPPLETLLGLDGVVCDEDLPAAVRRALAMPRPDPQKAIAEHSWEARLTKLLAAFDLTLPDVAQPVRIEQRPFRQCTPHDRRLRN